MSVEPINFSWVIPQKVAASGIPDRGENIQFIIDQGIKALINLSGSKYSFQSELTNNITIYDEAIPDFSIPTVEQIQAILLIVETHLQKNEAVLIHCTAGCGRTGTILAALLLHLKEAFKIEDAISQIRVLRPCSIETKVQEIFLLNNY